jgi:hypothetical protein
MINTLTFEGTPQEFHRLLGELSKLGCYMGIEKMRQVEKLDDNELRSVPIETDNRDICQAILMVNEKYDISKLPESLKGTVK